jgi:hypothetical protein
VHFIPCLTTYSPCVFLSTVFSNTFYLFYKSCSSRRGFEQFHIHRVKIIHLNIFIVCFSTWGGKICTEWKQAVCEFTSLTIAVWIGFCFVTVTPKQFNLAAFLKYWLAISIQYYLFLHFGGRHVNMYVVFFAFMSISFPASLVVPNEVFVFFKSIHVFATKLTQPIRTTNHIAHLRQQCHNSKSVIFQKKLLKVWNAIIFYKLQRRHNCSSAASFANRVMTLYLLKVHLQTFLSIPITQKC